MSCLAALFIELCVCIQVLHDCETLGVFLAVLFRANKSFLSTELCYILYCLDMCVCACVCVCVCGLLLLLTGAALSGSHVLGAQVGSIIVRFMEVVLFPFTLLVEILEAVQHGVGLLLDIITCRKIFFFFKYS